jgi:hypothetical protein
MVHALIRGERGDLLSGEIDEIDGLASPVFIESCVAEGLGFAGGVWAKVPGGTGPSGSGGRATGAKRAQASDIQIPEETAFELLASLGDRVPRILFTTAYDAYALRAFEFGAVD